jgi:hypothetical protein
MDTKAGRRNKSKEVEYRQASRLECREIGMDECRQVVIKGGRRAEREAGIEASI